MTTFSANHANDPIFDDLKHIESYLKLKDSEKLIKELIKKKEDLIDQLAKNQCDLIKDDEVKELVIEHKWKVAIQGKVDDELDRINQYLTSRLKTLVERYEYSYAALKNQCDSLEAQVESDLKLMGFDWRLD